MKQLLFFAITIFLSQQSVTAQLTTVPDGGNKKAIVGERVGLTDITISYNRPGVKGREGKIWGGLVLYGFNDLGFGSATAAPWRAGANESTTIEFSTDVKVEGNNLPAGKYGFFVAVGKEESILIFSKNNGSWGSFFYDIKDDALRITVKQQQMDKPVEWLKYEFIDQTASGATIALEWEKWLFPFKVETDVDKYQVASFRKELKTDKGFNYKSWAQAAEWCADHNTNLEEGLQWANYAVEGKFVGEKNFRTLTAKARILTALGKTAEADLAMKEALPLGNMNEVHTYARQLLSVKRVKDATAVFKANYKKFPNTYTTNMGMTRMFSSEGNYKDALKYANASLLMAPDAASKLQVQGMIEQLKAGKDVN